MKILLTRTPMDNSWFLQNVIVNFSCWRNSLKIIFMLHDPKNYWQINIMSQLFEIITTTLDTYFLVVNSNNDVSMFVKFYLVKYEETRTLFAKIFASRQCLFVIFCIFCFQIIWKALFSFFTWWRFIWWWCIETRWYI